MPTASSNLDDRFPDQERLDALTWKPLRLLTFYRAILAGLLLVLFFAIGDISTLGLQDPALYTVTCSLYLGFSLLAGFTARLRHPGYVLQSRESGRLITLPDSRDCRAALAMTRNNT